MKKIIFALIASLGLVGGVQASSGGFPLDKAPVNVADNVSLQRGARTFVNYCLSCHSAAFMRYNRLTDIGLTEQQIKDNLLITTDKVGETMKAAINPNEAKDWFGGNPPDLTVIARSRSGNGGTGADYLYTFLRTFYRDDTKATGWNNLVFPSVGMPHVLWQLQGERKALFDEMESHGEKVQKFKGWEQISAGTQSTVEFDQTVGDLVNYLQWMGEPAQNTRVRIGVWVLLFISVFILIAWRLNAAYWKDVK
ncbi:cytochrome c1 [Comamonas flocculans]|uniref:Cytochrome c1 n=1 Tax=Comamonas flocculans TaxID=2597701 RepID=A0A5B8RYZ8_9BURK|nr:cytochrome c1 [Comamonas flocculans]QEA14034.1 cytochrome c1 [Comamonas flocculans]